MSTVEILERLALQNRVFPEVPQSQAELRVLWNKKLSAVFGSRVIKLALDIFGPDVCLDSLQKVFHLQTPLLARAQEQPHLLGLLAPFVRANACPCDFAQVREYYGLSAPAWRVLSHCSSEVIHNLAPFLKQSHCRKWIELLVKSQCAEQASLLSQFNQGRPAGFAHYDFMLEDARWEFAQTQLKRLFLAYGRKAQSAQTQSEALLDARNSLEALGAELYPDFLANVACVHKNTSFDALVRMLNERWQQATHICRAACGESVLMFPSIGFDKFESENFEWTFIANSQDLIQEGQLMRHCVGNPSYIANAAKGQSLVFSVTRKNTALLTRATAEIVRSGAGFICSQIKGPGNSSVTGKMVEEVSVLISKLSASSY